MVWVGELVNGGSDGRSIRPYPQDMLLNHGTLLVNRGQGAIWIEDLPFQGPVPDNERLGLHMHHHDVNVILIPKLEPAPPAEEEEEEEEREEETFISMCACTEAKAESNREITQEAVVDESPVKEIKKSVEMIEISDSDPSDPSSSNSLSSPNQIQETPDYIRSNQRNINTPIELFSGEISHEKSATVTVNSGELERDRFYDGGDVVRACIDVGIESLYCSARVGEFSYRFDQLEEGDYEVDLHFAEIMFTEGPPGMQVFDVFIQEKKVVSELDVYEKVGCSKSFIIQNLRASVKGKEGLSIRFEGLVGKPIVCGISVQGGCSSFSGIKDEVVPILGEIKELEAQLVVERKLAPGPAVKRLSRCPSAKQVPLNKPQFRHNSLATIPAASVLAPQHPSVIPSSSRVTTGRKLQLQGKDAERFGLKKLV
ncbi:LRR receptor-like serine/threonine-protein kinase [Carex littledalei]|uniref:LRR receptor-like serine/threonine-protein kinase n=1 Tax=Carex littledalei TaxID=544730 RepID=A0A833QNA3_9POAL|nr:LRR receptor-like serine/threonine-protein kinase [Carex littledalei]